LLKNQNGYILINHSSNKPIPSIRIPYWAGMLGGYCFDFLAWISRKKLPISNVRVKKFCAVTQFDATKAHSTNFTPPYPISQAIDRTIQFEFLTQKEDNIIYLSE
jgi:hypothetical protein